MIFPIEIVAAAGKTLGYAVYFLVGMGFGAILEAAGFGDSRRLTAQFYLRDMAVLKVMFTALAVGCVLIFGSSALGLLDFGRIAVNPTYLWPGMAGGLVMGVGFVIGGFCPGTSLVAASTLKVDGIAFLAGALIGVAGFGETVASFYDFWHSSYHDRWLLSDLLGWSIGATVMAVVVLALAMFGVAALIERRARGDGGADEARSPGSRRWQLAGAGALLALAAVTWIVGQPDPERRWNLVASKYQKLLDTREVYVHPLEYVKTWNDPAIRLMTLDLRPQSDFRSFHLDGARRVDRSQLVEPKFLKRLLDLPPHGIVVLASGGEAEATAAWRDLKAMGVTNVYVLEGGVDGYRRFFAGVGGSHADLDLARLPREVLEAYPPGAYQARVKLKVSRRASGTCS